jgi:hypothetical protein
VLEPEVIARQGLERDGSTLLAAPPVQNRSWKAIAIAFDRERAEYRCAPHVQGGLARDD